MSPWQHLLYEILIAIAIILFFLAGLALGLYLLSGGYHALVNP